MFKKWGSNMEDVKTNINEKNFAEGLSKQQANTILKGSRLIGDINISCDLELSGEVEGNITSEQDSNIAIQGNCKGNIKTGGNVTIGGEFNNGDIIAGGDVKLTGKFNGGEVKAKGKVSIDGEFNGKLEGNEIEVGSNAKGKGELLYKESISISRGAKIEAQIRQIQEELKMVKKPVKVPEMKVVNMELPAKGTGEGKV